MIKGSGHKNPRANVKNAQRREKAAHIIEQAEERRREVYKTDPSLFQQLPGEIRRTGEQVRELENRLRAYQAANPGKSAAQQAKALGVTTGYVYVLRARLKRREGKR